MLVNEGENVSQCSKLVIMTNLGGSAESVTNIFAVQS